MRLFENGFLGKKEWRSGLNTIRILVVITTEFVPYGGLTSVAMNYFRAIDYPEIHIDFCSTNVVDNTLKEELNSRNSYYYQLPKRSRVIKYINELNKLSKNYDIIHIHANSATATIELLAATIAGVKKRIVHIHNSTCKHLILHRLLLPLFYRLYTDAIACSKLAGQWIFVDGNYEVMNNAINIDKYRFDRNDREEIRKKYGIDDELVVGHVGKFTKQKNHRFLFLVFCEIYNKNNNAKLMLVGDGELHNSLFDSIRELGIEDNVIFCGMTNSSDKYLSAMDVFVFPSLFEGLPLSVIEAQANGLNCILSDTISPECDMGGITQLSLEDSSKEWGETVLKCVLTEREYESRINCEVIKNRGFDVNTNVDKMLRLYMG